MLKYSIGWLHGNVPVKYLTATFRAEKQLLGVSGHVAVLSLFDYVWCFCLLGIPSSSETDPHGVSERSQEKQERGITVFTNPLQRFSTEILYSSTKTINVVGDFFIRVKQKP